MRDALSTPPPELHGGLTEPSWHPGPRFASTRVHTALLTAVSAVGIGAVVLALPGQVVSTAIAAGVIFGGGWAFLNLPDAVGGLLLPIAAAGLAIVVPLWAYRCHRNLGSFGVSGLRWSPGWAAGAWFLPFGNLVICYGVVREIWSASGSDRGPEPLVWLWWAYWLAATGLAIVGVGSLLTWAHGAPFGPVAASATNAGLDLWPVSWGLLALLAWGIQARQELRFREVATRSSAQG